MAEMNGTTVASPSLIDLAAQINVEHRLCEAAIKAGLQHAVNAGVLLLQAKALTPHGGWLPWLREHFEGSERTAQAYMRVARELPALAEGDPQRVADLSFRGALHALAAGRGEDAATEPPSTCTEWWSPLLPWLEAERAKLGPAEPELVPFEHQLCARARLMSQEMLVPDDLMPCEWRIIGWQLGRWWDGPLHDADCLKWWLGAWANAGERMHVRAKELRARVRREVPGARRARDIRAWLGGLSREDQRFVEVIAEDTLGGSPWRFEEICRRVPQAIGEMIRMMDMDTAKAERFTRYVLEGTA